MSVGRLDNVFLAEFLSALAVVGVVPPPSFTGEETFRLNVTVSGKKSALPPIELKKKITNFNHNWKSTNKSRVSVMG